MVNHPAALSDLVEYDVSETDRAAVPHGHMIECTHGSMATARLTPITVASPPSPSLQTNPLPPPPPPAKTPRLVNHQKHF